MSVFHGFDFNDDTRVFVEFRNCEQSITVELGDHLHIAFGSDRPDAESLRIGDQLKLTGLVESVGASGGLYTAATQDKAGWN